MAKAGESDQGVMSRLGEREEAFKSLAVSQAALKMPRLQVGWSACACSCVLAWFRCPSCR